MNSTAGTPLEMLTVDEVAALMRVSRATVYRLTTRGQLPARKIGRAWRFSRNALEAYLCERTPSPVAPAYALHAETVAERHAGGACEGT